MGPAPDNVVSKSIGENLNGRNLETLVERSRIELIVAEQLRPALVREIELLAESSGAVMGSMTCKCPAAAIGRSKVAGGDDARGL